MTAEREALVARLRTLLADEPSAREVSMFGGTALMVEDRLVASASRQGGLLVRVAAERESELLAVPGAARGEKGRGRVMSAGWIAVAPAAVADDASLAFWIDAAMQHLRGAGSSGTAQ